MYKIVAQSFPNNEVRLTFSPTPSGRDPFAMPDSTDVLLQDESCDETEKNPPSSPLSLVPNPKLERSSAGFGSLPSKPTVFGLNAKRTLIRQGGAMEHVAPPEECLFLTGTLPGSTEDSFRAIAEWSGYIVHRLKAWVAKYVEAKLDFYSWEYQRRGALHLHYCLWVPDDHHRRVILAGFRAWWIEILHRVGDLSGTDMFRKNAQRTHLSDLSKVRAVAEVCRKSPARYLAKYLSKSASPTRGNARFFTPSRWWGTSRPLKALAARLTETIEVVEAGVNAVRRVWEDVNHMCDSSESVQYQFRHRVGIGETIVCYPKTNEDKSWLLLQIKSLMTMNQNHSQSKLPPPSQVLPTLKAAQVRFLEESLTTLPGTLTGLRNSLQAHLSWIQISTESSSQDILTKLLAIAANTSNLISTCQFSPLWTPRNRKRFDAWINCLEQCIEEVSINGWS